MHLATAAYLYLIFINIVSLCSFGIDKSRAKAGAWRIPEKDLFLVTFLGGGIGSILGMYIFHHKTKHVKFVLGIPLITLLELAAAAGAFYLIRIR